MQKEEASKDAMESEDDIKKMFFKKSSFKASRATEVVEDQETQRESETSDDASKPKKGAKVYAADKIREGVKNDNPHDNYVPRDGNGGRGGDPGRVGRVAGRGGRFGRGDDGNVSNKKHCYGCGNTHDKAKCPAYDNECGFCDMIGHFERCCYKKNQARAKAREEMAQQQESSQRKENTMEMVEQEEKEDEESLTRLGQLRSRSIMLILSRVISMPMSMSRDMTGWLKNLTVWRDAISGTII